MYNPWDPRTWSTQCPSSDLPSVTVHQHLFEAWKGRRSQYRVDTASLFPIQYLHDTNIFY